MRTLAFFLTAASLWAQVKLPPHTKTTLANGLTLILTPNTELPLVSLRIVVRGGIEAEPAGKAGLATLTAELLRRGTAQRSSEQIAQQLDAIGANLGTAADYQSIAINAEFLSQDTDRALEILTDILLRPAFPEAEVTKLLAQTLDSAKAMMDNAQTAVSFFHRAFFYGAQHPYARAPRGDETTIPNIKRADILAFHQRFFAGKNLIVVAAGNFAPDTLRAKLEKMLGPLPAGSAFAAPADPGVPRAAATRLLLVDKPDATQTYFYIGQPGIRRGHPDEVAIRLVNTLFGGRFTSMLNDELRVNSGLTYGANSIVDYNRITGGLTIATFTKTESTGQAIDLALATLKKLNEQGITADQLKSAKAYVKGTLPIEQLETQDQIAAVLSNIELYGLNRGEIDDLFSKIDAVTLERANQVIRQYYRPGNLVFTLLGNAAKIRDAARKYSPDVREVAITKPGY